MRKLAPSRVAESSRVLKHPARGRRGIALGDLGFQLVVWWSMNRSFVSSWIVAFLLGSSLALGEAQSGALSVQKKILPWIEVNIPDMRLKVAYPSLEVDEKKYPLVRDYAVAAMKAWRPVADTFAVTSRIECVDGTYNHIMRNKPAGMRIIGGLKTYNLPCHADGDKRPYDFANAEGWKAIADASLKLVQITGVPIVILENETTLMPFHDGRATIDLVKLKQSLKVLNETDIEYWWNLPIILDDVPELPNREAKTTELVRAIAEAMPKAVFLTQFVCWKDWETNPPGEPRRRKQMLELVGQERFMERFLVSTDGYWTSPNWETFHPRRVYTPADAISGMGSLTGNPVCLYPDPKSWIAAGDMFSKLSLKKSEK